MEYVEKTLSLPSSATATDNITGIYYYYGPVNEERDDRAVDELARVPYTILQSKFGCNREGDGVGEASGGDGYKKGRASSGVFNLVVVHDFFDTSERMEIFLRPLVTKYPGMQVGTRRC